MNPAVGDMLRREAELLVAKLKNFLESGPPLQDDNIDRLISAQVHIVQRQLLKIAAVFDDSRPLNAWGQQQLGDDLLALLNAVNVLSCRTECTLAFIISLEVSETLRQHALSMRKIKDSRVAANHVDLDRAVKEEAESQKRAVAIGEQFALDIRDGVCARLKLNPAARGMTTISAIIRSARRIRTAKRGKKR